MKVTHATTVFAVEDLQRAVRFYTDALGFAAEFRFDHYAGVRLGDCRIGLSGPGDPRRRQPGAGEVYVVCEGVDEFHRRASGAGARVDGAPESRDYGMRDFALRDPDGNVITFGTPLSGHDRRAFAGVANAAGCATPRPAGA